MALAVGRPPISTSKIVLWPVSENRIREICLGSTSTATGSCPAPYRTAGILPATRTRRAAFLLNLPSRALATTTSGIWSLVSFIRARPRWGPAPFVRARDQGSEIRDQKERFVISGDLPDGWQWLRFGPGRKLIPDP